MDASQKRSVRRRVIGWALFLLVAGLLVVLRLRYFMLAWVVSGSMEPTFYKGDLVIINHAALKHRLPVPGEIVALQTLERDQVWVKRAVAGPGDVVALHGGLLYRNGRRVDEPYIRPALDADAPPARVPEGHVWVLGDNRGKSDDSRNWGPLRHDYILGKAVLICWPRDRFRRLP